MTFEERLPQLITLLSIRKSNWRLTIMDWEDVSQIILTHFFNKYEKFDPNQPHGGKNLTEEKKFEHWANRVITNQINNILRNNLYKFSRPCINGCPMNAGDFLCQITKSGKQCSECPLYAKWKQRKGDQYNIAASLPIENHSQEVSNKPTDFLDVDRAKLVIDTKLKVLLNSNEWQMYDLIWIKHLTPEEAGKTLKYKPCKNSKIPGYQAYMKLYHKVIELSKRIIQEEHLA